MLNIKLSKLILNNIDYLNINEEKFSEYANIFTGLLDYNFKKIVNTDTFFMDEDKNYISNMQIKKVVNNKLHIILINYLDKNYYIYQINNELYFADDNSILFKICIDVNTFKNIIFNKDNTITKFMINTRYKIFYTYQKINSIDDKLYIISKDKNNNYKLNNKKIKDVNDENIFDKTTYLCEYLSSNFNKNYYKIKKRYR